MNDHAVLVHLPYAGKDLSPLFAIEDELMLAIQTMPEVGELDGNDVGQGEATLYLYGPDADRLFAAIEPVLRGGSFPPGSVAVKRYGPPGSPEEKIELA